MLEICTTCPHPQHCCVSIGACPVRVAEMQSAYNSVASHQWVHPPYAPPMGSLNDLLNAKTEKS